MSDDVTAPAAKDDKVAAWLSKIGRARKAEGMVRWRRRCAQVRKKYRYADSASIKTRHYQLLWSNVEVLRPAVYAKPPKAAVIRRFNDPDRVARTGGEMLERCIDYLIDANDFDTTFKQVRDDFLLEARGQARVMYEPIIEAVDSVEDGLDGSGVQGPEAEAHRVMEEGAEDGRDPTEILSFEHVKMRYLHPEDFVHEPARTWEEVTWVAFRAFLDRDALIDRFGEKIGKEIPLDSKVDTESDENSDLRRDNDGTDPKATVWEIWDKCKREVLWIAAAHPKVLEQGAPYLVLEGFFPCPRPAYGTLTNDTLEPVPDYVFYQDQCEEIDGLTARIGSLQQSLKVVGFYPAGPKGEGAPEIERAALPGVENKLIAVKSWAMFSEGKGGNAPIVWYPVEQVIKVLEGCVKLRQQLIDDVYQIAGISDIMRGDGNAQETATAQNIKAQFGSTRLRPRQQELARFCRDICRLTAEIICNHFQPDTIMAMSNMPLPSQAEVMQQQQLALIEQQRQMALQAQAAQPQPMMAA